MTSRYFVRFFLFFALVWPSVISAQDSGTEGNEQVIMNELSDLLNRSELINDLGVPVLLRTNMPDRNRMVLFNRLLEMGKTVKLEGDVHRLQLMVYADNSLNQTDREQAERRLGGELQLFLSDTDDELMQTETLQFTYSDTIHIDLKDAVQSEWAAGRFHQSNTLAERNRWREYGQPAVIVAATGVTVFLLFNLRSN